MSRRAPAFWFRRPPVLAAQLLRPLGSLYAGATARRLAREVICDPAKFGDERYGREELIAELCAAMLAGECGILPRTEGDSAAYLDGWRRVLKSDVRLIVQAAAAAQRAADWVQGRRFERTETRETAAA